MKFRTRHSTYGQTNKVSIFVCVCACAESRSTPYSRKSQATDRDSDMIASAKSNLFPPSVQAARWHAFFSPRGTRSKRTEKLHRLQTRRRRRRSRETGNHQFGVTNLTLGVLITRRPSRLCAFAFPATAERSDEALLTLLDWILRLIASSGRTWCEKQHRSRLVR